MAKIPQARRVVGLGRAPAARLTTQATPAAFGAREAQDLGRMGGAVQGLGHAIIDWSKRPEVKAAEERALRSSAMDSANRAMAEVRTLNANDYYRRKGQEGTTVLADANKAFQSIRSKYLSELTDEKAQAYFTSAFDGFMNSNLGKLSNLQIQATEQYETNVRDAWNLELTEQGVLNWNDFPGHISNLTETMQNVAANYPGDSEEAVTLRMRAVKEAQYLYSQKVIAAVSLNESPETALKVLDDFAELEAVDPRLVGKLRKDLREKQKAVNFKQDTHDTAMKIFNSGKSESEQLEAARKLPAEKAEVVENKLLRWRRQEEIQNHEETKRRIDTVNDTVYQLRDSVTVEQVNDIIEEMDLGGAEAMQLQASWSKNIEARDNPQKTQELMQQRVKMYADLSRLAIADPSGFQQLNIAQYAPVLGKEYTDRLTTKQIALFGDLKEEGAEAVEKLQEDAEAPVVEALKMFDKVNPFSRLAGIEDEAERTAAMVKLDVARTQFEEHIRAEIKRIPPDKRTAGEITKIKNQAFLTTNVDLPFSLWSPFSSPGDEDVQVPYYMLKYAMAEQGGQSYRFTDASRTYMERHYGIPEDAPLNKATGTFTIKDEQADDALRKFGLPLYTKTKSRIKTLRVDMLGKPVEVVGEDGTIQPIIDRQQARRRRATPVSAVDSRVPLPLPR